MKNEMPRIEVVIAILDAIRHVLVVYANGQAAVSEDGE